MACHYRRGNRSNTCDAAQAVFNADDWLGIDPAGHLFDGLAWLLRAAQEWQIQSELNLGVDGYAAQVYAMDSVFLRVRSLFEFFVGTGPQYCHAHCLFDLNAQLDYPAYAVHDGVRHPDLWENVLHVGSLHLQDRSNPIVLTAHDGTTKDLNRMPVDFAKGILDVWQDFEQALNAKGFTVLYGQAKACREQAEEDSRRVVDHTAERAEAYNKSATPLTKLF
jgi:hypothetical protein